MKDFLKNYITRIFVTQAKRILKKHTPIVVAVVGSIGKTSTKRAIATVLAQKYRVLHQSGNYNTLISVPFIITNQELPALYNPFGWIRAWLRGQKLLHGTYPYDVVVLELGTDKPGDINDFKKIVHPEIAVITAISEEHMEFFTDIEAVAEEELSIAQFSKQLVINADDIKKEYQSLYIPKNIPITTYGFSRGSSYKLHANRSSHHSFAVSVTKDDAPIIDTDSMVAAKHSLLAIGAAVSVADMLGVAKNRIVKGVQRITPTPGRMRIFEGKKNTIIIDDTYNSSPLAAEAAIKTLYEMKAPGRIAILGSMNELGPVSNTAHESIGSLCKPDKLDLLITIGEDANRYIAAVAEQNGCSVIRTSSPNKAGKVALQNITKQGTIVLLKGSQNGVFLEEAVKELLANPSDQAQLVRQSAYWLAKKATQFKTSQ